jgi:hypothetical protein
MKPACLPGTVGRAQGFELCDHGFEQWVFSNMAKNYVIRSATARRIGGAHRKVRDATARLSDMKEREGVLRCIANACLAFPIMNFNWQIRSFSPDPQAGTSWK